MEAKANEGRTQTYLSSHFLSRVQWGRGREGREGERKKEKRGGERGRDTEMGRNRYEERDTGEQTSRLTDKERRGERKLMKERD